MASIGWRDALDHGNVLRVGVGCRRCGVEPIDVREQHQKVRADHGGNTGCKAIVVAIADLAGRHCVVLVDHGHGPHFKELQRRGAGVEIAPPLLRVREGHEDLPGGDAMVRQHL
jgi:hypothetical protein